MSELWPKNIVFLTMSWGNTLSLFYSPDQHPLYESPVSGPWNPESRRKDARHILRPLTRYHSLKNVNKLEQPQIAHQESNPQGVFGAQDSDSLNRCQSEEGEDWILNCLTSRAGSNAYIICGHFRNLMNAKVISETFSHVLSKV